MDPCCLAKPKKCSRRHCKKCSACTPRCVQFVVVDPLPGPEGATGPSEPVLAVGFSATNSFFQAIRPLSQQVRLFADLIVRPYYNLSGYDSANGVFTVPSGAGGTYQMYANLTAFLAATSMIVGSYTLHFALNGVPKVGQSLDVAAGTLSSQPLSKSIATDLLLEPGDQITVLLSNNTDQTLQIFPTTPTSPGGFNFSVRFV
jgi:hypothetical protein